jgi:predicted dehydrogenase
MGRSHALAYHQLSGFEIAGIVTRSAQSREALISELGGGYPGFSDFEEALRLPSPMRSQFQLTPTRTPPTRW